MGLELRERLTEKLRHLVSAPLAAGSHHAQVIAIASSKGGVGKTTSAVNLAVALARQGYEVLLLDLDPQAHVAAALGLPTSSSTGLLADVLLGRRRDVSEIACPTSWPHLQTAGSDKTLAETEMVLAAKIGKELLLSQAMGVTKTYYDVIIIDCPPNLGTLTLNALCAADHLLIPSDMSVLALEGVADIINTVKTLQHRLGRSLEVCGILATRWDKRATQMNQAIVGAFTELYGEKLLKTQVPQTAAINKAHMAGKPIFDFDARSTAAKAYTDLANELVSLLSLTK